MCYRRFAGFAKKGKPQCSEKGRWNFGVIAELAEGLWKDKGLAESTSQPHLAFTALQQS